MADDAEGTLLKSQGELTLMTNARAAAKDAADARDRCISKIKELEQDRTNVTSKITVQNADAHSIAFPEEPTDANVTSYNVEDPRYKYMFASCGGIALVFVLLIFISAQVSEAEDRVGFRPAVAIQSEVHEPVQV